MKRRMPLTIAVAGIALFAVACGGEDSDSAEGAGGDTRTVEIDMVDIAFEPDTLEVEQGERVRFVFTNTGEVAHDAFIGDADAQADHEAQMRDSESDDDAHGGHGDDAEDAVTVEPGDSAELTYTFDDPGRIEIGCHQPGHYDAGMKVTVNVA